MQHLNNPFFLLSSQKFHIDIKWPNLSFNQAYVYRLFVSVHHYIRLLSGGSRPQSLFTLFSYSNPDLFSPYKLLAFFNFTIHSQQLQKIAPNTK